MLYSEFNDAMKMTYFVTLNFVLIPSFVATENDPKKFSVTFGSKLLTTNFA